MASSSSSQDVVSLPYVNVQSDFEGVVRDVGRSVVEREDFWISRYQSNTQPTHGTVHCQRDQHGDLLITTSGGVTINKGMDDHPSVSGRTLGRMSSREAAS